MKKILVLLIVVCSTLVAQRTESSSFSLRVKYGNNKWGGFATTTQNESGFLTGVIYGNDSLSLGVSSQLHASFLNSFSDNYWKQVKGEISKTPRTGWEETVTKMIVYSIYPKRTLTDSLLVYCKYITYTLKSVKAVNDYNYDIVYSEEFLKVLLNEEVKASFIQSQFPKAEVNLKIVQGDENFELTNHVDKSPFPFEEVRLKDYAEKSQLSENGILFGIDLVRTDRNGNKVILKRTDFPLKSFLLNTGTESIPEFKTLYYGFIEVPVQIYNPAKLTLFNNSNKSKKNSFCSVYVIPLVKEKNNYNLELIISRGDNSGNYSYSKKVTLAAGEKINIELQPDNWRYEEVVEGERMQLNSEEDYNKYVKDYLILTLEEGKDSFKDKSQTNNRDDTKAKFVETRTQADYERSSLSDQLYILAKNAIDYCYSKKKEPRNWEIPREYMKYGLGIYRIFDTDNGIEIEGVGRAIGNDKISPVKLVIRVISQRKATTHYVKNGESVRTIAAKYRVSSNQIISKNRLKSQKISVGQKLIIDEPSSRNNLVISQVEVKN
ncbi:MAG: LysM peptidoglycan-binding domain-containing protein [Ignavibacteriales bacterium]|nr:LysM peptidoglycan-binding domain-containing protein [Ignavibacteriales bacterium]